MIPLGEYRYEIRRSGDLIATEEDRFAHHELSGVRRFAGSADSFEAHATLDESSMIARVTARYSRGPFSRNATYEANQDFIRGSIAAMGSRIAETAKLGRYREIDCGLVLFRALMIAHLRTRGQARWTSRVATIDPSTLAAQTHKKTLRNKDGQPGIYLFEPQMGDAEEIEIDDSGRIIRMADNTGHRIELISFVAAVE
ncbi:MAG TPA: hypothetical protein VKR29_02460 [Candidatus Binataceae bacterium]|nr:hypothetical protein [Candidatus Binataceae bacterium]